jgi:glycosyltransferase involved in cell wall biosynthesis
VLEAMLCGAPVVTSRDSAMAEVTGDAAELVDPLDVDSIATGIERALSRRVELRAAGLERARRFGWPATADAVVDCYRRAVA